MNLLEVRTQFIKLSGRYDLVVDAVDFADNGADYYIKAGIKFLDRRVGFDKDIVKVQTAVVTGDSSVSVAYQRVIEKVWLVTSTDRVELTYLAPADMVAEYGLFSAVDNGTPKYFTMGIDSDQLSTDSITFMPPTDASVTIEVWFKRNTPFPALDTATCFWMDRFEDIGVKAALYQLEVHYRNTAGARDWLAAIELDLLGVEKDTVEDDANRAEEMDG